MLDCNGHHNRLPSITGRGFAGPEHRCGSAGHVDSCKFMQRFLFFVKSFAVTRVFMRGSCYDEVRVGSTVAGRILYRSDILNIYG